MAAPRAVRGILDLKEWDLESKGIVSLSGEWEFYWKQLIKPQEFSNRKTVFSDYFSIPGIWNRKMLNGQKLNGEGYATYRLVIHTNEINSELALQLKPMASAYRLFVNGKPLASNGKVGTGMDTTNPYWENRLITFYPQSKVIEIVLWISNYHIEKGGPWTPIEFGLAPQIKNQQRLNLGFDLFLVGALLIMTFYHSGLFIKRRSDYSSLFLAIFCLNIILRQLCTSERFLLTLIPGIDWEMMFYLEFLSAFWGLPLFLLFLHSTFTSEFSLKLPIFALVFTSIMTATALLLPIKIFVFALVPFHVITVFFCGYSVFFLLINLRHHKVEAIIILAGCMALFFTVLVDIAESNQLVVVDKMSPIGKIGLIPLGTFMLVLGQSLVLAIRFSNAFSKLEAVSYELQQSNQALKKVDQLKDEFLVNTSHELKTPLHGITGLCESLKDRLQQQLQPADDSDFTSIIASSKRLSDLVDQILDFSRIKQKDFELNLQPVALYETVELVIGLSNPLIGHKTLKLTNSVPRALPLIMAEEYRLQQILHNLIGNAIKFTDKGQVEVTAAVKNQVMEIKVSDTGCGIDPSQQHRIFERFEQLDGSLTRKQQGIGLGLSITRILVEAHHGDIDVETTPGQGTTFIVRLPLAEHTRSATITNHSRQQYVLPTIYPSSSHFLETSQIKTCEGQKDSFFILVVDDDPVNLQVVESMLRDQSFRFRLASDGREALAAMETYGKPDLVLLDIMMPNMSGLELCQKLRERYPAYELPIIFLTVKKQVSDLVEGFALGANDYLPKPFSRNELIARVQNQIQLLQGGSQLESLRRVSRRLTRLQDSSRMMSFLYEELSKTVLNNKGWLTCDGEVVASHQYFHPNQNGLFTLETESLNRLLDETKEEILVFNAITVQSPIQQCKSKKSKALPVGSHWLILRFSGLKDYVFHIYRKPESVFFGKSEVEYVHSLAREVALALKVQEEPTIDAKYSKDLLEVAAHLENISHIHGGGQVNAASEEENRGKINDSHSVVELDVNGEPTTLTVRVPLHILALFFPENALLRIHRSFLVNPKKIDMKNGPFKKRGRRDYELLLKNKHNKSKSCPIARGYKEKLQKRFALLS